MVRFSTPRLPVSCSDYKFDDNTFGQDTMKKHYENGEMNQYDYQNGVRAF